MVWRKAQFLQKNNYKLAAEWLETLNHPILQGQIGDLNLAKIERKLMHLYEQSNEWNKIPEKKQLMSLSCQQDIKTLSYMFSYYIHENKLNDGMICWKGYI